MLNNILNQALSVIPQQPFQYLAYSGRVINDAGQDVPAYDAPLELMGSIQPVKQALYYERGLDFAKKYYNVYCSRLLQATARDFTGDRIIYNGMTLQVLTKTEWQPYNGWDVIMAVVV